VPLNLYRRHQRGCEAHFPVESKTGEFEERKRGWKRCGCFIFATGTLSGKFKRRYTGKTNWDEAKAVFRKSSSSHRERRLSGRSRPEG
jgi:hypothetical protein